MKVMNVHERLLPAPPERVGALLDALAGPDDRLWLTAAWPELLALFARKASCSRRHRARAPREIDIRSRGRP